MNVAGLGDWGDLEVLDRRGDTLVLRGQQADGRPVLVKTHATELPTDASRARLRREHDAVTTARHPHLVRPVALVDQPQRAALVVELAEGPTLAAALRDGHVDADGVLRVGQEVAEALAALHAAGLVHRSVDAGHIVLTEQGAVLVDLYDACRQGRQPRRATQGAHPAPEERATHLPPAEPAADQHALAVTVRQALAQVGVDEPPPLRTALERATHGDPRRRHRSVLGLADAFASAHDGRARPEDPLRLTWQDPADVVGRDELLAEVDRLVERAAEEGRPALVVLSGRRGSGRSRLLAEACDRFAERGIVSGLGRYGDGAATPLRGPTEAIEQIVGQLLARSDDQLEVVRRELEALGPDLPVICQVLPSLQQLVGPQPTPPPAGPEEAVARIELALQRALRAIANASAPLVAAFDDLDRADATSLRGLEVILTTSDLGPLVAVVTTAGEDVRLREALDHVAAAGVPVAELAVEPLREEHVRRLVAEGTGSDPEAVAPLAQAVFARSGGNPQVALADLWALLAAGDLWPDAAERRWRWSPGAEAHDEPATVEEVAAARLEGLGDHLREAVLVVAVAGRLATVPVVAAVTGHDEVTLDALLAQGVAAHVLAPTTPSGDDQPATMRCSDDGVRQAARARADAALEESVARAVIASRGLDGEGRRDLDDDEQFELVHLLAEHPWVQAEPAARHLLVALCEDAARAARRRAGFQEALDLQRLAIDTLGEQGWEEEPERTFELHLRAAEHALAVGDGPLTDALLDAIDAHDPTPLQRVRTMKTVGTHAWMGEDHGRGLEDLGATLAQLGQAVPSDPTPADLAREVLATQRALGRTPPERFLDAGPIEDEQVQAALDAMIGAIHLAYLGRPALHVLLTLRGTRLTAEHGVAAASSYFLTSYGMLQLELPGRMGLALRFGAVGQQIGERFGGLAETMATFTHNGFVRHWGTALDDTVDPMLEHYRSALALRQRGYGFTGGVFAVQHALLAGRPLDTVDELAAEVHQDMVRAGEHGFGQRLAVVRQAVADLRDGSEEPLDGEHFSASGWLAAKRRRNDLAVQVQVLRTAELLRRGRLEDARATTAAAGSMLRVAPGQAVLGVHWFHQALLDAEAVLDAGSAAERVRRRTAAERSVRRLRRLARHAPANAAHRVAFVEALLAEGASRRSSSARAMAHYEEAVALATERGALDDLGLVAQRAARFHQGGGRRTLARHYASLAHDAWSAWGASALADGVAERLPGLLLRAGGPPPAARDRDRDRTDVRQDRSDLSPPQRPADEHTFAEATRLLGEELEVRELLERLVEILVRHAQASRAFLVLEDGTGPAVEVAATFADDVVDVVPLPAPELHAHEDLCAPAVHWALRTRSVLSIAEPADDRRLRSDPALRRRSPRALLCLPVGRAAGARGVLVLESDHHAQTLEAGSVEALRVLSEQAIAAIDRARLTSDLSSLAGDVAQLRATAADLVTQAETDPLTGVANRLGLESQVGSSIEAAHADADRRRPSHPGQPLQVGVLFCDLDGFKEVNDTHGHAAGDLVLEAVAARLAAAVRAGDIVARVGGDEFVVVSVGVTPDELRTVADRLVAELARPVDGPDGPLPVTASIGVGQADLAHVTTTDDVDALVQLADQAMYRAKQAGKNQVAR